MSSLNKCLLIGRLTKDVEIRYTPQDGIPVANFTLAVDRPVSKGREKETDFVSTAKEATPHDRL